MSISRRERKTSEGRREGGMKRKVREKEKRSFLINIISGMCLTLHEYRIAGNIQGRKLSRIGENRGENFCRLLTCAAQKQIKDTTFPNLHEKKNSQIASKTRNSRKFSPSKVSHYTVVWLAFINYATYQYTVEELVT